VPAKTSYQSQARDGLSDQVKTDDHGTRRSPGTLATLQRHCRIRSYLTTTANHGIRTIDAIRDALNGTCWMPPTPA
jgi:hypothetical protein